MTKKQLKWINALSKKLVHVNNIKTKYKNNKKNNNKMKILKQHVKNYEEYHNTIIDDEESLKNKIAALNIFKNKTKELNLIPSTTKNGKTKFYFSSQGKFEPTIIEEFLYLILNKIAAEYGYESGSIKAYNNIFLTHTSDEIKMNCSQKDQDFSIYNSVDLSHEEEGETKTLSLYAPVISCEVKTYLDKTMLESAASTANRVKNGSVNAKFFIVAETYDVDEDVPLPKNIDAIYVLRKCKRNKDLAIKINDIYLDIVETLLKDIKEQLDYVKTPKESLWIKK